MTPRRLLPLAALAAVLTAGCSPSEPSPAPVAEADTAAAPAPVEEAPAAPAGDLAKDVAEAREILANYGGDGDDLAKAKELLLSVLKRDRDYAPAYVELARLEYKGGYLSGDAYERTRLINAEKFLNHAFSLESDLPNGHLARARVRLYLGELDLAEESLAAAEASGIAKAELDTVRARIAAEYHDVAGAMRLARSVIDDETAHVSLRIEMLQFIAPQLAYEGFRADAQAAYEKVIELEPDHAWGHGNYASFLLGIGEVEAGLRHAERAVEIMPYPVGLRTLARASIMRAEELHREQRFAEAGTLIERMVKKVGDDDPDIHQLLGDYYWSAFFRTSDVAFLDRAIEKYRAALALDPGRKDATRGLERATKRKSELAG